MTFRAQIALNFKLQRFANPLAGGEGARGPKEPHASLSTLRAWFRTPLCDLHPHPYMLISG